MSDTKVKRLLREIFEGDVSYADDGEVMIPQPTCDVDAPAHDNDGSSAGAGYMPRQNLYHIWHLAHNIHDILSDDDPVEDWVEDKITSALTHIEDVAGYVGYRNARERMRESHTHAHGGGYRSAPYDDNIPVEPRWSKRLFDYIEDAQEGLGMSFERAYEYAMANIEDDKEQYREKIARYNLKNAPSSRWGHKKWFE